MSRKYSISPNGIYWSIQGEGHLRGQQMAFVRLAGCSVGCPQCDTDYSVARKLTPADIAKEVAGVTPDSVRDLWVWITGGEPYDRDLHELIKCLRSLGFAIAVATSGVHRAIEPVDWLSVSPHDYELVQRFGAEIKLIEGLNGLDLQQWSDKNPDDTLDFFMRYVQPLAKTNGGRYCEDSDSYARCLDFLKTHPNWSLSRQDHHDWALP